VVTLIIGVILAYAGVGGPPVHLLLRWFGLAVLLGAIVDRWVILWAAVVPSGLRTTVLLAFVVTE
jgi:ABC-type transport system involved in multi-copper enzyme maturation permease subunit